MNKPNERKQRIYILTVSAMVMFVLGIMYVWSVFLVPIENGMGWTRTQTGFVFSLHSFCWTLGNLAAGLCYPKLSLKKIIAIGGTVCFSGMILSGAATQVWHLYAAYGVLVGIANGSVYNMVLSTCVKWYSKQGFPTGVLLMSYGIGGVGLSFVIETLINFTGWRKAFHITGILMMAVIFIGAAVLKEPDKLISQKGGEQRDLTIRDMIRSPQYKKHAVFSFLFATTGLIVLGSSAVCAADMGFPKEMILITVSCANLCNGFGRIICGIVFDKKGRKVTIVSTTALLLAGTILLLAGRRYGNSILALSGFAFTGLSYGFYCSFNPAYISRFFGLKNMPANNGFNCLVTSTASFVGPTISGMLYVKTGSYLSSYVMMLIFISIMSIAVALLLKGPEYEVINKKQSRSLRLVKRPGLERIR